MPTASALGTGFIKRILQNSPAPLNVSIRTFYRKTPAVIAGYSADMEAYGFPDKLTESECVAELMKMYRKLTCAGEWR